MIDVEIARKWWTKNESRRQLTGLEAMAEVLLENERLREQCAELQEIAVRVKLGQLETWPDASMTEIGRSLTLARKQLAWFEAIWPLANASIESACNCDLEAGYAAADWIRANPKP